VHALARDQIAYGPLVVKRGENRRLGPRARDMREDALGAAALI